MWKKSFKIEDSIYSLDIIRQAIADYSDYNIDLGEGEIFITWENKGEQEEIFNEFVNYCIALYNENL
jgi:hypothetical protein